MPSPTRRRLQTRLLMDRLEDRTTPNVTLQSSDAFIPQTVLVTYSDLHHPAPAEPFVASARSLGLGAFAVTLIPEISVSTAASYYAGLPEVIASGPDYIIAIERTPNDPSFGSLYGLNNTGQSGGTADADIDAPEAWDVQTGNRNTIVAVVDTGVDYNHPDLAANMWVNSNETSNDGIDNDGNGFIDDVYGYDFANGDANPMDDNGHGTHVAGTIGAVGNNGIGVTGVNWNTRIMALKFLGSNGSGSTSNAVAALNYAITMGAHISNHSWGGGGPSSTLATAINRGRSFNHVVVAAAGNNGSNNNTTAFYPANYTLSYDNVVSVASTTRTDTLSSFSNYGATAVTLAAPGSSIYSTTPNNSYSTYSGTSMAAPHVSGALALLRDQNPTWTYQELIAKLKSSVDPLAALTGKVLTGGRLNVAKMLDAGVSPPPPPPPPAGDTAGPMITAASYSGVKPSSIDRIRLTFNEPVNAGSFTLIDIPSLTGPLGKIRISAVTVVSGSNNTQFDVTFRTQTALGTYTLVVGPGIYDIAANAMNQNGNAVNGENPDDQFTFTATLGNVYTFTPAAMPVAIPDLSTVRIPIVVGQNIRVTDLNVRFDITHTYNSDLRITLESPNGTVRTLVNRRGGSGENFTGTVIDDEAATAIANGTAPFNGSFRPEQALTAYDEVTALGTWYFVVRDMAEWDVGTVNSVSLIITGTPILSLALGTREDTPPTVDLRSGSDEGKWDRTPIPLAVWVGPERNGETRHLGRRGVEPSARLEGRFASASFEAKLVSMPKDERKDPRQMLTIPVTNWPWLDATVPL
jgi:subtilisin family serine protease/subtilisin-like proprotein convertase family protein